MATSSACVPPLEVENSQNHYSKVFVNFSDMQERAVMTDFSIELASGKLIAVHRNIMYASSDYFKALLTSGMKEANEGKVEFKGLSEDAVCGVVDYLYGRKLTIPWDNVDDYLDAVETFQLSELKQVLEEYCTANISPQNCLRFYKLADKYGLKKLQTKSKESLASGLSWWRSSKDFRMLNQADVINLLSVPCLASVSNDLKLKAIIHWVKFQEEERKESFPELLEAIELNKCSAKYLKHVLEVYENRIIT